MKTIILSVFLLLPLNSQTFIDKQVTCISQAIYYEAGNQNTLGKEAVAFVIFNRAQKYNMTPCEVINQRINGRKQFTFISSRIKYWNQYITSFKLAQNMYWNFYDCDDPTHGALFFHAVYIHPHWHCKKIIRIQDHIFYK